MNASERMLKCGDLLRTFVVVAERKSVTRAAETLGKTQSAISVQMTRLEDTLEVRLFSREPRGVSLTPDGERLLPVARRIAYASDSLSGVRAAVRAGFAIGALPQALLDPTMIVLGVGDGFPPLPPTARVVATSPSAPPDLAASMADAIKVAAAGAA